LAKYFPPLDGEDFDLLVKDIAEKGQLQPIIMIGEEILDGVNRWRACEKLGKKPITEQFKGNDPLAFVISMNLRRRHLEPSQRAAIAQEMMSEFEKQARERQGGGEKLLRTGAQKSELPRDSQGYARATEQAAKAFGVSARLIQQAKRVQEKAPEKMKDIIAGKLTVGEADEEISRDIYVADRKKSEENRDRKLPAERPKAVKEYFDSCKYYKDALKLAIACAKQGMFAPEAIRFAKQHHENIRDLMATLEGAEK
jgi:hypothetical protein